MLVKKAAHCFVTHVIAYSTLDMEYGMKCSLLVSKLKIKMHSVKERKYEAFLTVRAASVKRYIAIGSIHAWLIFGC